MFTGFPTFSALSLLSFLLLLSFDRQDVLAQKPGSKPQPRYLIFLHGRMLEEMPVNPVSPEFGPYDFEGITGAFANAGLTVIAERRPQGTSVDLFSKRVTRQVDSLKRLGVPSDHITVVGTSKGSVIAMYAATVINDPNVNFVFIAACDDDTTPYDINFCGNILSIYEAVDSYGTTCEKYRQASTRSIPHYKEIKLTTGLKHGFIYTPMKEWIEPTIQWAHGNYDLK